MSSEVKLFASPLPLPFSGSKKNNGGLKYFWHVSVFVFETEISYSKDGVETKEYGEIEEPLETSYMGSTLRTKKQLKKFVADLESSWKKTNYNCLKRNCLDFAKVINNFLGIEKEIPTKYTEHNGAVCLAKDVSATAVIVGVIGIVLRLLLFRSP